MTSHCVCLKRHFHRTLRYTVCLPVDLFSYHAYNLHLNMLYTKPEIRAALFVPPIGVVLCDHSYSRLTLSRV